MTETSRVLTLVFTDLADSTALKTERGDRVVHDLIEAHRAHVTRLAQECAGRVIDWAGDGCFLTFETSSAAALFALRLQHVHSENADLPGVRVGIHMGEVSESPGPGEAPRVDGLAVDLAARISGLSKPGQVLMSAAVYNSAKQRLGVEAFGQPILWQAHGTYELKGFDEALIIGEAGIEGIAPLEAPKAGDKAKLLKRAAKVTGSRSTSDRNTPMIGAVFAIVLLIGAVGYLLGTRTTISPESSPIDAPSLATEDTGPITSLAVLPLDNLMNDPEQDYFADGMTEAIIAELAKIQALKVISRTSVMQYRDTDLSMREIAAELSVEGLIEGSVLRDGDEIRITVQLIDGRTDTHVWSESYTETITSVLKLQSDIALAIADEIKVAVTPEEEARVAQAHEVNPEAYNAFLLGQHFMHIPTVEAVNQAIEYFEDATELDPDFADAWAYLGRAQSHFPGWGIGRPQESYALMRTAVRRAIDLDSDNAMAHALLAQLAATSDWDWKEADRQAQLAVSLAPNDAMQHVYLGKYLVAMGESDRAIVELSAALDLDPYSSNVRRNAAQGLTYTGEVERAIDILEAVLRDDPGFAKAQHGLARAYSSAGRHRDAIALSDRFADTTEENAIGRTTRMRVYAGAGRDEEARAMLGDILTETQVYFDPFDVAETYLMLGDLDEAFEWFEKSVDERGMDLAFLRVIAAGNYLPHSEHIQAWANDPRYWDLVERIGFPPLPLGHPRYDTERAWLARKAADGPIEKLAVLPFENISNDPDQEYFVDGMTEALIAELAKIKSIKVISRTSAMRYKGSDKALTTIARELDVDGIVEGSVLKAGNDVRITAQLINGRTDEHIWAESYTNTLENVLRVQAEVALSIAGQVDAVVTQDERTRIAAAPTVNLRAYELYIEGRALWSERTAEGFEAALDRYNAALEIDPDFALAHLGLADTYLQQADYYHVPALPAYERAKREIDRAFELNPNLGEAFTSRARYKSMHDLDLQGAAEDYERALTLNPADATAHLWYGIVLGAMGRRQDFLREVESALELDPFSPIIAAFHLQQLPYFGFTEQAVQRAEELRLEFPDSPRVAMGLAVAYRRLGQCIDARAEAMRYYEMSSRDFNSALELAAVLAACGDDEAARAHLEAEMPIAEERGAGEVNIAAVYALLGDQEASLDWLERAFDTLETDAHTIPAWSEFEFLHDHPRYQALRDRLNITPDR